MMLIYLIEIMESYDLIDLTQRLAAQHVARVGQELVALSEAEQVYAAMVKLHDTIGDFFGIQMNIPELHGGTGLLLSESVTRPHIPNKIDSATEHHFGIIISPKGVYESLGFGRAYERALALPITDRYSAISDNTGATLSLFLGTDAELEAVVRQSAEVSTVK